MMTILITHNLFCWKFTAVC